MGPRTFKKCLFAFLLLLPLAVFGEPTEKHDPGKTGPAPLVRPEGTESNRSVEELRANVKEKQTAGSAAWWASVQDLLGQISEADAKSFSKEIAEGRRQ